MRSILNMVAILALLSTATSKWTGGFAENSDHTGTFDIPVKISKKEEGY